MEQKGMGASAARCFRAAEAQLHEFRGSSSGTENQGIGNREREG